MIAEADQAGDPVQAYHEYRALIGQGVMDLDTLINYAFLCWQFTEYSFNVNYGIPLALIGEAGEAVHPTLDRAKALYPQDSLPVFWGKYFQWRDEFLEELTPEELWALARGTQAVDPWMWAVFSDWSLPAGVRGRTRKQRSIPRSGTGIWLPSWTPPPGEPLSYDPRFGVTRDNYQRFLGGRSCLEIGESRATMSIT